MTATATTASKETVATPAPAVRPAKIGQTFPGSFPSEMRRQLWPLCCGASILSGFKNVNSLTEDELVKQITTTIDDKVPDFQVFDGERMMPKLTFLTLNSGQTGSPKIMSAIKRAGFVKIGEGRPRGGVQSFFVRDTSGTFTVTTETK